MDLKSVSAAYVVEHSDDGHTQMELIVNSEKKQKHIAEIAENYILKQLGATDKIVDFVFIKVD